MLDPKKINSSVKDAISCMLDMDCNKPDYEENLNKEISYMDVKEAFKLFLEYNGIHGYTMTIINAYEGLKRAEVKR
jgi:hypothetical protein